MSARSATWTEQAVAERRFRPEFTVAFDAWMATDSFHNPQSPPGPAYMPQYKLADQAKAEALDREAVAAAAAGNHAGQVGDDYIRITVFLAAVLFLVGLGSTFKRHTVRYALISVGSLLLILSTSSGRRCRPGGAWPGRCAAAG